MVRSTDAIAPGHNNTVFHRREGRRTDETIDVLDNERSGKIAYETALLKVFYVICLSFTVVVVLLIAVVHARTGSYNYINKRLERSTRRTGV
ncbi:hypothetical protein EJ02DRAFT_459177 [Clathrospora elynae]|uniref:Uncharacterized protein n=1 Tax=Clathrospora elynae TaxID=706981 RepID=A0A6A5SHL4_9PLEO|nr:hypothetical protein EJ02DRAFT_459177 [Clathrospora elynae]